MKSVCVAVVDAVRARVFTLEELDARDEPAIQELRERVDLLDPDRRLRTSELFSETHRDAHVRELNRRFAGDVVARIAEVIRAHGCRRLVLAAGPGMLGALRRAGERRLAGNVSTDELSGDLTHLSPAEIQEFLAERGLVPPRERLVSPAR